MLKFVGQVHMGVKGVVFMPDGTPAKNAEIGKVEHKLLIIIANLTVVQCRS